MRVIHWWYCTTETVRGSYLRVISLYRCHLGAVVHRQSLTPQAFNEAISTQPVHQAVTRPGIGRAVRCLTWGDRRWTPYA